VVSAAIVLFHILLTDRSKSSLMHCCIFYIHQKSHYYFYFCS